MAERHPGWVNDIDAFEARLATGLPVMSQGRGDALDPLRVRSGVRDAPGFPGLVTLGTNKVTVNPFQAVIADATQPATGPYLVTLDAIKELSLNQADERLSRIDLIIAQVDPSVTEGFIVRVVPGDVSATPQRPTPANLPFLELAEIRIPPAGTPPTLTDKRQFTAGLNGILPIRNADDRPRTVGASVFVYRLDTRVLEVQKGGAWVAYRPPRGDGWHAVTFQNGWTNYGQGWPSAAYTLTDDGWVRLRGMVRSGALDKAVFTLPVGYRPPVRHLLAATTSPDAHARVDVLANGEVIPLTANAAWLSLDGIAFATY